MQLGKTSIVIADDNTDFVNILNDYLSSINDFTILGMAHNGIDALDIIIHENPDVVILDIVMPRLDGLGVLQRLNEFHMEKKSKFIVLSAIGQDTMVQAALSLGADYYILKPFNLEDLVLRIKQIQHKNSNCYNISKNVFVNQSKGNEEYDKYIVRILADIGVPEHLKGNLYLQYAIKIVLDDLSALNSIHKVIYSKIAEKFNTTPTRAERAIRNAIEITWTKGNFDKINMIFSNRDYERPTNSEFIIKIVEKLKNNI